MTPCAEYWDWDVLPYDPVHRYSSLEIRRNVVLFELVGIFNQNG